MSPTNVPSESSEDVDLLAQADAIHDDDPVRAREMLRQVVAARLPADKLPRLAFLLDHVLGEKLDLWDEAFAGQRAIIEVAGATASPTLLRQAAIAAQVAGDDAQARTWTEALAAAADAPLAKARALVSLGAVVFSAPRQDAETAGRLTLLVLQPLAALHALPGAGLDTAFGIVTNNLASDLLDRPLHELDQPDLRTALELTAEHSQRFWKRAGQWVNFERALYLRALAANALGRGVQASEHARAGVALLDEHDVDHAEDVDRAFLELELSLGLRLAKLDGVADALQRAQALAARFEDASLDAWFAARLHRNAALAGHYGRG